MRRRELWINKGCLRVWVREWVCRVCTCLSLSLVLSPLSSLPSLCFHLSLALSLKSLTIRLSTSKFSSHLTKSSVQSPGVPILILSSPLSYYVSPLLLPSSPSISSYQFPLIPLYLNRLHPAPPSHLLRIICTCKYLYNTQEKVGYNGWKRPSLPLCHLSLPRHLSPPPLETVLSWGGGGGAGPRGGGGGGGKKGEGAKP